MQKMFYGPFLVGGNVSFGHMGPAPRVLRTELLLFKFKLGWRPKTSEVLVYLTQLADQVAGVGEQFDVQCPTPVKIGLEFLRAGFVDDQNASTTIVVNFYTRALICKAVPLGSICTVGHVFGIPHPDFICLSCCAHNH